MRQTLINASSKDAKKQFQQALSQHMKEISKAYDEICVACIGTDRSTWDSLGPLVGYKLSKAKGIRVIGNSKNPLHAKNLEDEMKNIRPETLVIAVDACLGEIDHVGYINIKNGPIRPGSGVGKDLSSVGDISICGIVNFGGFILQNTRLSVVMEMADIIADGLKKVLKGEEAHVGSSPTNQPRT